VLTEGFFHRWSRLKDEAASNPVTAQAAAETTPDGAATPLAEGHAEQRLPTLEDVARLSGDSDYSAFMARGVDKAVQRGALKKLFADPHFNLIDGLDVYMADYNKPDPVSAAMLGALQHAQSFFAQAIAVETGQGPGAPPDDGPPAGSIGQAATNIPAGMEQNLEAAPVENRGNCDDAGGGGL
jgi:hypothetical protein